MLRHRLAARIGVFALLAVGLVVGGAFVAGAAPDRPAQEAPPDPPSQQHCHSFVPNWRVWWRGEELPLPLPVDDAATLGLPLPRNDTAALGELDAAALGELKDPAAFADPSGEALLRLRVEEFVGFFRSYDLTFGPDAPTGEWSDAQWDQALREIFDAPEIVWSTLEGLSLPSRWPDEMPAEEVFHQRVDVLFVCREGEGGRYYVETPPSLVYPPRQEPDDPPPDDAEGADDLSGQAREGTCLAIKGPWRRWRQGEAWRQNLPETLPVGVDPTHYGRSVDRSEFDPEKPNDYALYCRPRGGDTWALNAYDPYRECNGGGIIPQRCFGKSPTTAYDLDYDPGELNDPDAWNPIRRLRASVMGTAWDFSRGLNSIVLWLIGWSFTYDFELWQGLSLDLAGRYGRMVEGWRLELLAWLVLVWWAGMVALRGRTTRAAGQVVTSVVLVGLGGVLLINRETYMNVVTDTMERASTAIIVVSQDDDDPCAGGEDGADDPECDPQGCATRAREGHEGEMWRLRYQSFVFCLQDQLHRFFVEQPYDYLQWGDDLGSADDGSNELQHCARARDEILERPDYDGHDQRAAMERAGCNAQASYNADASMERMTGSLLNLGVAILLFVVFAIVLGTFVVAKYLTILVFAAIPFGLVSVVLPAAGRRFARQLVDYAVQGFLAVLVSSALAGLVQLAVGRLLTLSQGDSLWDRWTPLLVVLLTVIVLHEWLINETRRVVDVVASMLREVAPDGFHGPRFRPSDRGFDFTSAKRSIARGAVIAAPVAAAGTYLAARAATGTAMAPGRMVGGEIRAWRERKWNAHNLAMQAGSNRLFERPPLLAMGGPGGGGDDGTLRYTVSRAGLDTPERHSLAWRVTHPRQARDARRRMREVLYDGEQGYWKSSPIFRTLFPFDVPMWEANQWDRLLARKTETLRGAQAVRNHAAVTGKKLEFYDPLGRRLDPDTLRVLDADRLRPAAPPRQAPSTRPPNQSPGSRTFPARSAGPWGDLPLNHLPDRRRPDGDGEPPTR